MTPASTGRAAPPPLTYTFPNGVTCELRRMSQFTIASLEIALRKRYPPPEPPLAPGVGGDLEPNEADPTYEAALAAWQQDLQIRQMNTILDYAVIVEIDQEALAEVRGFYDRHGLVFDEISDTVAYVKHCCVENIERDLLPLTLRITGQAAPSEADVQAHVATFPGTVGQTGPDADTRAALEDSVLTPV